MKKKLAALLVLVMSVCALAACGADDTGKLAEPTLTPSVELVETEGDVTDLGKLPVEEYVTLGDYKNLNITMPAYSELTEEEFDLYVQSYFYTDAAQLPTEAFATEGTVAEGDVVLIDYEGKLNGVAFEGGTATDQTLGIGADQFIDGFEDGLIGVEAGKTVDLNLTFPENYGNTELAGKEVVFTVTVKGIASLNDATVAAMGHEGYETVEDYKEAIEIFANYEKQSVYYSNISDAISVELLNICTVEKLPKQLYEQEKQLMIDELQMNAAMYGMDGDSYAQAIGGMNLNDYVIFMTEAYIARGVILQAIANAEGIAPTDEDADEYVKAYIAAYGEQQGIDSVEAFYKLNPKEDVKIVLLQQNVFSYLADIANITETE